MGTRGFITFVASDLREPTGEVEKTTYNHLDSYPEGLGVSVLEWLRDEVHPDNPTNWTRLVRAITDLRVVHGRPDEEQTPVTPQDIKRLATYADLGVDTHDENNQRHEQPTWYQLLRGTQGDPAKILASGYLLDAHDFPRDSLFAEWGYVVDTRRKTFEVYEGFQKKGHNAGRFAHRGRLVRRITKKGVKVMSDYYPVKEIFTWPLTELPTTEWFVTVCGEYVKSKYGE